MIYSPYRLSDSEIHYKIRIPRNSKQNNLFNSFPPLLSFSILSFLFHISFIHPISNPSSFGISPRSFPSLSPISLHPFPMCSIVSLHITHSALLYFPSIQHLFSLSSFPHLNLAIIFLSLYLSLPRYIDSLTLSLLSCLSVSLSLSLSSAFIHLHFALDLSTSSLAYPFLL
jgi:hypothetical protein